MADVHAAAARRPTTGPAGADAAAAELSVVVPSVNGWGDLEGCLAALDAQAGAAVEVVVVDRVGESVRRRVRESRPHTVLIEVAPHTTIPEMRALGFRAASAPVVGVIEDHVIVPPDWAARMLDAHRGGAAVVGGAVVNAACDRLVDWAAFLCEYSHCLTPPAGASDWLTGNNVTYRRELLERFRATVEEGRWEDRLHDAFRAAGITLESRPDIVVGHKKHYTVGEYLYQRYVYARAFAGMRLAGAPAARRAAFGLAALALPPLLLYRTVRRVLHARRHGRELVRALPLLFLFTAAWSAGEAVGYIRGPGDALARVC